MLAIVVFAHFVLVVATVRFNQLIYSANEEDRLVEIALILSQPVSTIITVTVSSIDISAKGKYIYIYMCVCVCVCVCKLSTYVNKNVFVILCT